jgi:prepilin-type N-terminal cleavage/methylation domain-containing protein
MSNRRIKSGLTLIELLIALAMVVAIISMVNAGFFAASRSAESCTGKMTLDWQQLRLIDNIAGQLRCACAPAQSKTCCFEYNPAVNKLHFLTTRPFDSTKDENAGLLEVDYKFDSSKGALLLSERRFVEKQGNASPQWRQIAENIKDMRLEFFDGRQWSTQWNYNEQNNLPSAVRITVKYQQADLSEQQCSTTAFVCLAGDSRQTVQTQAALKETK